MDIFRSGKWPSRRVLLILTLGFLLITLLSISNDLWAFLMVPLFFLLIVIHSKEISKK